MSLNEIKSPGTFLIRVNTMSVRTFRIRVVTTSVTKRFCSRWRPDELHGCRSSNAIRVCVASVSAEI